MPGMNGFELAARLRQLSSKAALVFLTVHDEQEFIMAAKAAGALGYVEKPRLAIDLLHAVREARGCRSFLRPLIRPTGVRGSGDGPGPVLRIWRAGLQAALVSGNRGREPCPAASGHTFP